MNGSVSSEFHISPGTRLSGRSEVMNYDSGDAGREIVAKVEGLHLSYCLGKKKTDVLRGINLTIDKGEIVALVGESGSGKSVLGLTLMGLHGHAGIAKTQGSVVVSGRRILTTSEAEMRQFRRECIGAVFQDPMTSLNPTMRIGKQLSECNNDQSIIYKLLMDVGILDPKRILTSYPHELSGGLRQRVMIAMALASSPALIVADEPTTALDVTVQAQILNLIARIRHNTGVSFLFITHDLAVAATIADRILVMYSGKIIEGGTVEEVLDHPRHPYTCGLLASRLEMDQKRPLQFNTAWSQPPDISRDFSGCSYYKRCEKRITKCQVDEPEISQIADQDSFYLCWNPLTGRYNAPDISFTIEEKDAIDVPHKAPESLVSLEKVNMSFNIFSGRAKRQFHALRNVTLDVARGEAIGIVGESGSGKSTLLRLITGLITPTSGNISLHGNVKCQMIFQDAGSSLTPWMTIGQIIDERLVCGGVRDKSIRQVRIAEIVNAVGLTSHIIDSRPAQLSGGQRQRAAIARAIAIPPDILVCDEPTSALDVTLAATVLQLILNIQKKYNITLLFVTHDLAVARAMGRRILVMYKGQIVEDGDTEDIINSAKHPYTKLLLSAVPRRDKIIKFSEVPEVELNDESIDGCSFYDRCGTRLDKCKLPQDLLPHPVAQGHIVRCCNQYT